MADPVDIRVMVPRVRRALEGAGAPQVLSDDDVLMLTADAIGEIILYTGGVFGKQLLVMAEENGVPSAYGTDAALTLPEQAVIASQAALNYFFQRFAGMKVSERVGDEAQTWEYTLSANLLQEQLRHLIADRDRAIDAVTAAGAPLDSYTSFLAVRDHHVSQMIEPWVHPHGIGGQEDYRFGRC